MKNEKSLYHSVDRAGDQYTNDRSTRRTEITIETREIKTIRMRSMGGSTFCDKCGEVSPSYGPAYVAAFLQISLDDVQQSIDAAQLHLTASGSGPHDICGNSLKYLIKDRYSDRQAAG